MPHQKLTPRQAKAVIARARQHIESGLETMKPRGSLKKIGVTTAEDDMTVVEKILDHIAVGFQVAIDGDANSLLVLGMTSQDFARLTRMERDDLLSGIDGLDQKLKSDRSKAQQISVCFLVVREAITEALKEECGITLQFPEERAR